MFIYSEGMARTTGSHGEITAQKVREAALELFSREGYAAVSMRRIAAEVGVQAGALYNYTPDKQGLLFALMETHMRELLDAWAAEGTPGNPRERLEHFTDFHIRFHVARPRAVFIAYMELRNLEHANFAVIEGLRKDYEAVLEGILVEGQATGVFRVPDVRLATMGIIAMLTGVSTWYHDGGRLPLSEVQAIYRDMVRGAVGG